MQSIYRGIGIDILLIQELLAVTDLLITDYSSIALDYINTRKPVIIYASDIEEYKKDRDFHIKIEETPLEDTFDGLAGMGDLIVTATSVHSRNNKAGFLIGQGKTVEEVAHEIGMVVERCYYYFVGKKIFTVKRFTKNVPYFIDSFSVLL